MPAPAPQMWRTQTAIVMQRSDRAILAELKRSQTALNARLKALASRSGFSNRIREAQIRLAKREIQLEMANLFRKIGDITSALRLEAASRVLDVNRQLDLFKFAGAGLPDGPDVAQAIADAELDAARSGVDRMIARAQGASYNQLSQRVYNAASTLNGPISTLVNSALASGLSAREFANSVKDFINPNTPGGVRYAAMRLARTEINNAAHAVAVDSVQDKPWVTGMKWHLSGSHPRVDICNSLASGGPKNDGIYAKNAVPAKPHPQCFCYVTPETPDDDEFLDNLIGGKYDDYLAKYRNKKPGEIITTRFGSGSATSFAPVKATPKATKAVRSVPPPPPDPHPGVSKLPRIRGGSEDLGSTVNKGNGSRSRFHSDVGYQVNCQQVVHAVELRKRGYDVMARTKRADYSVRVVADGWTYPNGLKPSIVYGHDFKSLRQELSQYKEGERAWVYCAWQRGGAHIFNVEIKNGEVVWHDGQNQQIYARERQGHNGRPMSDFNRRVRPGNGWGIIGHVETLIPDDGVLKNVEPWKLFNP